MLHRVVRQSRILHLPLSVAMGVALLVGCSADSMTNSGTVTVTPSSASLEVGATLEMVALVRDGSGNVHADLPVSWSSSDSAVASVNAKGLVTALAVGSADIAAMINGATASATITVTAATPLVGAVAVTPGSASLLVGTTRALAATVLDETGSVISGNAIVWSSSAPGVATVDASGVVTGVAPGSAAIIATSSGKSGAAVVTVLEAPVVTTVEISPAADAVPLGGTRVLSATVKNQYGNVMTGQTIVWSSSDPHVATVNASGVVAGLSAGAVTITATSGGKVGTASVIVVVPATIPVVTMVAVVPTAVSLTKNATQTLNATVLDQNGSPMVGSVTWSSGNPTVATVNSAGVVTAVAVGSTTITATSGDKSGTATVAVVAGSPPETRLPATVTVSPSTATIKVDETVTLVATVKDQFGQIMTDQALTWRTEDSQFARVNPSGVVTGMTAGRTITITATVAGKSGTAAITVTPYTPVPTFIFVTPAEPLVGVGLTVALSADVRDQHSFGMPGQTVTWSSGDPAIATVTGTGVVTGVTAGMVMISATAGPKSVAVRVTVATQVPWTVTVTPPVASVPAGERITLTATVKDQNENVMACPDLIWRSSDAGHTIVDRGVVLGLNPGVFTITAICVNKSGTAVVTITPAVGSVAVAPTEAIILVGATQTLTATVRAPGGAPLPGEPVTWLTNDASVATVSTSGLVTGVGAGTATITATSSTKSASATITVASPSTPVPTTVVVTPPTATIPVNGSVILTATVKDQFGNPMAGQPVTWSTNDSAWATVGATTGIVVGKGQGTVIITATCNNKTGTASVTVVP